MLSCWAVVSYFLLFQYFSIINDAAGNILHTDLCIHFRLFSQRNFKEVRFWKRECQVFQVFDIYCQIALQEGCTNLLSHQPAAKILIKLLA